MNTTQLLYSLCLGFLPLGVFAQHTVSGRLSDCATRQALSYATVRLLQQDSSFVAGTVTDSLGCYQFSEVKDGSYLLAFSTIGYKSQILPVAVRKDTELPSVALESDNVLLGEVVVKGSSFIRQKDKVLILPDKEQVKHVRTGYDLLNNLMIPSINVDRRNGEVTTFGGNVSLYIDGRKVDYREVQSLRPRDVEKVEYIDVPTGKYAQDVAAINYITKKYKSGGYVTVDGMQTLGYLNGDYNLTAKLSDGNTNYTLFGGHTMKQYHSRGEKKEDMFFPESAISRNYHTEDALSDQSQQYVQLNVENSNEKRTLMVKGSLVHNDAPDNYVTSRLTYPGISGHDLAAKERTVQSGLKPGISLYGNFHIRKNQNLEITLTGDYSRNSYDRYYTEGEEQIFTNTSEDLYSLFANANYQIKLRNQNALTFQLFHFQYISSTDYSGSRYNTQDLLNGETLLFMEYNHRFGDKWMLFFHPGVSFLNYRLNHDQSTHLYSLRWNTGLSYYLTKSQILAWYVNIGNENPQISTYNEVDQEIDFLQIQRGNPNMKNTKLYNTSLMYTIQGNKLNFMLAAAYNYSHHNIFNDYYIEGDRLIKSYSSDGNLHRVGSVASFSWKVNDRFRLKLDGQYIYSMARGKRKLNQSSLSGTATANYYWKDFSVNAFLNSAKERLSTDLIETHTPVRYGLSVGWNHGGWSLEAGTENLFVNHNKTKSLIYADVYDYHLASYDKINQQLG